jgi:hypothetical protein
MTDDELAAVVAAARRLFGAETARSAHRGATPSVWQLSGRVPGDDRHAVRQVARADSRWAGAGRLRD